MALDNDDDDDADATVEKPSRGWVPGVVTPVAASTVAARDGGRRLRKSLAPRSHTEAATELNREAAPTCRGAATMATLVLLLVLLLLLVTEAKEACR